MTSASVAKKRPADSRLPLKIILASGGLLTTLVGGNMIAGRAWVNSIVPNHQVDETLMQVNSDPIPEIGSYIQSAIELPDLSTLPQPIDVPEFTLQERVMLVGGSESGSVSADPSSVSLPEIPQIAAPVIPQRPQINTTSVDLNLAPIPQVNVPAPVTSSSSSG